MFKVKRVVTKSEWRNRGQVLRVRRELGDKRRERLMSKLGRIPYSEVFTGTAAVVVSK